MFGRKPASSSQSCRSEIEALFEKVVQSADTTDPNMLGPPHLVNLSQLLQTSEDDVAMYVIPWKLKCATPTKISKTEWVHGFQQMRIDSLEKLRTSLPLLRNELANSGNFRDFYYFLFDWIKETPGAKYLSNDCAVSMWSLVFQPKTFPLLKDWLMFTSQISKKNVTKDLWKQTLDFSSVTQLSQYDPAGSWPTTMDEFVDWSKKRSAAKQ